MDLLSTEQVAALTGKHAVTVRRLARVHSIGSLVGNSRVFTEADVARIRAVNVIGGRPRADGQPPVIKCDPAKVRKGPGKPPR